MSGVRDFPPPPLANSFWIEPGRLLAGEYPGATGAATTQARLDRLIAAGITYFIDLTQAGELPPYDHLLPPARASDGRYIIYVRKPIRDHSVPGRAESMADILDFLGRALEVGHQVYVHCRAGIGRTNTVIGCWLRRNGRSGPAALGHLNELWKANARSATWPGVPENEAQARYIADWQEPAIATEAEVGVDLPGARALREKYLGCLFGLACGDALGATLQFRTPGQFVPVTDLVAGGHWQLPLGAWTDDTAVTLCIAESLLSHEDFVAADQWRRLGLWQREGHLSATGHCVGITSALAAALARPPGADLPATEGADSAQALPRVAAAVLFASSSPERALRGSTAAIALTDRSASLRAAGLGYAALLLAAVRGARPEALAEEAGALLDAALPRTLATEVRRLLTGAASPEPPVGRPGAIPAWLLAVIGRGTGFREGLLAVVNRGGEADVHGALYGQLAGALYGVEAIPKPWRSALLKRELLENTADRLLVAALAPAS